MPGYVSKEQIKRAREIDVLDYVLAYESGNVRRVGNSYRMKDHPSIEVKPGKWRWYSHGLNGRTALDYLTDVKGYGLVDAVCMLLGELTAARSVPPTGIVEPKARPPTRPVTTTDKPPPEERKPFTLPLRNQDNNRVLAYLQSRGIDRQIALDCIERGGLYENARYHNCVFVGRDENGKAKFAAMRGTMGDFKCDAEGSDKRHGFTIPPNDPNSHEIAVYESPIDALSHQTLCKKGIIPQFDGWRLSLSGTSLVALTRFLEIHTGITRCLVCTDNDKSGNEAAAKIVEIPGLTVAHSPPIQGKDWNETLNSIGNEVKLMEDVRQNIRFINSDYKTLFTVKDGDSIKLTNGFDSEVQTLKCRFIDEAHLTIIGKYHNDYHICQLAEITERNGSKCEAIPGQSPKLNILAAEYGEPLQNVEIPMTDAAIKELVGGKYEVTPLRYESGKIAAALVSGKDGIAVCGIKGETLTTLHPYTALMYKRELSPATPPVQDAAAKKPTLLDKLGSAKEKAAEHNAANSHGDSPKKRDAAELG